MFNLKLVNLFLPEITKSSLDYKDVVVDDDNDGVDDDDNKSQRADWKRKPGLSILNSKSSLCLPLLLIVMGSG